MSEKEVDDKVKNVDAPSPAADSFRNEAAGDSQRNNRISEMEGSKGGVPNDFGNIQLTDGSGTDPSKETADTKRQCGRIDRSQFDEQLKDPKVIAAFAGRMATEVGGQGAAAQLAFAEEVMNRAASRGQTLMQALSGSYYPTPKPGSSNNPAFNAAITKAWKDGTDTTHGATGNGDAGFGKGGYETATIGREKFGMEAVDLSKGWLKKYEKLKFGKC
ncbi:MAG: hypothetical protein K2X77_17860 [Candidatus Obscuribacterales bacterium]|nr:hypothetical protein [Candidatus Obscuribacterales bacterium]